MFDELRSAESTLSEPRIWPHHFDLGALMPLTDDGKRTIGVGFSPGDASFDQPYFYCSPYPAPEAGASLPPLAVGKWTIDGFTSAILTAEELTNSGSQQEAVRLYLTDAVHKCRALIQEGN